MTKLTVPIRVDDLDGALAQAAQAAERGADLVEYRIDRFYRSPGQVHELVQRSPLPCILTCRDRPEGGSFDGLPGDRASLLKQLADQSGREPAYVDVELASYEQFDDLREAADALVDHSGQTRPTSTGLILSAHDFEHRPANLYQTVAAMASKPACRVIKLAWRARSLRDNLEAFEILEQKTKPAIVLCMGEFGLPSRVLAKKFGALLTFASMDDSSATAPGQPTLDELKKLYRWDAIGPNTRVFGVIGWPTAHSLSPAMHNTGFEAVGYDGVYLPMPIPPEYEHFKATVGAWLDAKYVHFSGASVTSPHKEHLLRFVRERGGEIEPLAQLIGAGNSLVVREDGSLYAANTDYAAALDSACAVMKITREQLKDRRVAVIGAGGAARAIVAGLAQHGATTVIYNRTFEKAQQLAGHFADLPGKVVAARMEKLCDSCCHLFINGTPVGMHPNVDQSPIPTEQIRKWKPDIAVFDTIYNPAETMLLREAKRVGCATIGGADMLVRQAAAQFELWTKQIAPIDLFFNVVGERLTESA